METNRRFFPQYDQDPSGRHAKQIYHGSTFNQDIVAATLSKENSTPREARLDDDSADVAKGWLHQEKGETKTSRMANKNSMPTKKNLKTKIPITSTPSKLGHKHPGNFIDSSIASTGYSHKECIPRLHIAKCTQPSHTGNQGDSSPGIEGFQIVGNPRPGSTLRACGFPIDGTTLCNFQWVRYLEDGTKRHIEGASMYDYVVTADDVGTLLAVDCTPMDDAGYQGHLVREFANNANKLTCDSEMQNDINICISRGRAEFSVFVLKGHSPAEWERATLVLRRTGYQVNLSQENKIVIDEKYSPNVQTKIPNGQTTLFVLVSSGGVNLPFNTQGITEPNSEDNDIRLRDLIILVMRAFQNKAMMFWWYGSDVED